MRNSDPGDEAVRKFSFSLSSFDEKPAAGGRTQLCFVAAAANSRTKCTWLMRVMWVLSLKESTETLHVALLDIVLFLPAPHKRKNTNKQKSLIVSNHKCHLGAAGNNKLTHSPVSINFKAHNM